MRYIAYPTQFSYYTVRSLADKIDEYDPRIVVLYTFLASNNTKIFTNGKFNKRINCILKNKPYVRNLMRGFIQQGKLTTQITFPETTPTNVISQEIFNYKFTTEQQYNYIELVSNIPMMLRLEYLLNIKKHISITKAILEDTNDIPLVQHTKKSIVFPYEEELFTGVSKKWLIGHNLTKRQELPVM